MKNNYCSHKFKNIVGKKFTKNDPDIFSQHGRKCPLLSLNTQKKNQNDRKERLIVNLHKLLTFGKSNIKKTTHVQMLI